MLSDITLDLASFGCSLRSSCVTLPSTGSKNNPSLYLLLLVGKVPCFCVGKEWIRGLDLGTGGDLSQTAEMSFRIGIWSLKSQKVGWGHGRIWVALNECLWAQTKSAEGLSTINRQVLNKRPSVSCVSFPCKSKEWPQKRQADLMYLGPTERPPEEPEEKPSRPPLYVRLYRRLRLYWSPPRKGEVGVFWCKVTDSLCLSNQSELWVLFTYFFFSALLFHSLTTFPFLFFFFN